jgi:hypothetical protein
MTSNTKINVMLALIRKEEEAMTVCSPGSILELTYLICAFFKRLLFVASKIPVIVKNIPQVPICLSDSDRASNTRLIKPKKVNEKR